MVELDSEMAEALEELVAVNDRGESVSAFIADRMAKCAPTVERDLYGRVANYESNPLNDHYSEMYSGLVETGMLKAGFADRHSPHTYGELTSAGRTYIKDRRAAEELRQKELRDGRRHSLMVSIVAALVSFLFGAALTFREDIAAFFGNLF